MDFVVARDSPRMQFALLAAVLKWRQVCFLFFRRDARRFAEEIALTLIIPGGYVIAVLIRRPVTKAFLFSDPFPIETHGS